MPEWQECGLCGGPVTSYVKEHSYAPSIRQIGQGVGLSSSSTVHSHLKSLQTKGYLSRVHSKPRSISLLVPPAQKPRLAELEREVQALRHAMEAALANPEVWRETLETALEPMPVAQVEPVQREAA